MAAVTELAVDVVTSACLANTCSCLALPIPSRDAASFAVCACRELRRYLTAAGRTRTSFASSLPNLLPGSARQPLLSMRTCSDEGEYHCSIPPCIAYWNMWRVPRTSRSVRQIRPYHKPELMANRAQSLWTGTSASCSDQQNGPIFIFT